MTLSRALLASSALALAVSACGSGDDSTGAEGKVTVATTFYPLEYAASQVGGEYVDVSNLTRPGAEPHDLELTPQQTAEVSRADQLVYLAGFQPAIDDAVKDVGDNAFDVSDAAQLDIGAPDEEAEPGDDHGHGHGHGEGHDDGGQDPHFWLDPIRYGKVADAIAEQLAETDPDHAADYRANAKAFTDELSDLDSELKSGLEDCTQPDLVTGHAAFAYFADRYGFHQVSVSGVTPDAEPSPSEMADLIAYVKEKQVSTVYAETLVPSDLADTIARDGGAQVAVLDPIEGITDESAGSDYFEVMRSNLATVQEGQECT
ncbi:metal ABC transporter substrate-binding protein [Janibacter sp. GS2]|uniref:metal ABC transporter substrate-binding protein n=1 Tax=Janibacter sp. GS2 TaxID=3442646 RepID=UPI003EC14FDA